MDIKLICALLLFGITALANAQEQMTLETAIAKALENNFQIKIDETNIEIAENNNTWGRAGSYPTVDLTGNFSNTLINDNNPASFLNGTYQISSLSPAVNAQWLLYGGGRVRIAKEQLNLAVEQQRQLQSINSQNVIRDVIKAYYDVLLQQERLIVLEEQLKLSRDRMEYEKVKREFGGSNAFSIIQFEQAIAVDSTNLVSQNQLIEINKRNLLNLLNEDTNTEFTYPERLKVTLEEIDREKMRELLKTQNYSLQSLETAARLSQINTRLEDTARKPSVSLNGNLGFAENYFKFFEDNPATGDPFEGQLSNRTNLLIGASASWRIFDGGVNKANVQNAKIRERNSQLDLEESQMQLSNQLDILLVNYENLKQILKLNQDQIQIAERNLEMAEERLKSAQITSLDYRNLQNQLLTAQYAQTSAIYNLLISKTDIDWLVGEFL